MSSHHFVREGQEPAVLVVGTDVPSEVLGNVLEWCPQVVAIGAGQADWLLSMGIKVDVCCMLRGEDAPSFPYPADVYFKEDGTIIECAWHWLAEHPEPTYMFGWGEKEVIMFFKGLDKSLSHWPIAISNDRKWICPHLSPYCKWMKAGTTLLLTGKPSDWDLLGSFLPDWPLMETTHDGMVALQTKQLEIFGEPLYL